MMPGPSRRIANGSMIKRPIPKLSTAHSRINSARTTNATRTIGETGKKQSKAPMVERGDVKRFLIRARTIPMMPMIVPMDSRVRCVAVRKPNLVLKPVTLETDARKTATPRDDDRVAEDQRVQRFAEDDAASVAHGSAVLAAGPPAFAAAAWLVSELFEYPVR